MPESQWRAGMSTGNVTKEQAKREILAMASSQGIEGAFKVFYQDQLVTTPDNLPDMVDMGQVRVSEVLDQAHATHEPESIWFEWRNELFAVMV